MSDSRLHREIVQKLLAAKAVDFAAIGKVVAEVGPSLAASEDFDGDGFCGTNRGFVRLFRINSLGTSIDSLPELGAVTSEFQR